MKFKEYLQELDEGTTKTTKHNGKKITFYSNAPDFYKNLPSDLTDKQISAIKNHYGDKFNKDIMVGFNLINPHGNIFTTETYKGARGVEYVDNQIKVQ